MGYINDVPISDSTLQQIFEHCVNCGIVDTSFIGDDNNDY